MIIVSVATQVNARLRSVLSAHLLPYFIIAAAICACQKPSRREPVPPPIPPVVSSRYFLYDNTCREDAATNRPAKVYLTNFEQPLDLATSQYSLSTALIDSTFYGQTYQRHCHFHSERHCLDEDFHPAAWKKANKSGGVLRICATQQDYPRESFEHVALVSALHLQTAQQFFTASTGQTVPGLSLLVLPFFRTLYTDKDEQPQQQLMYRNIIYFPNSKSLAVLPDQDDFRGRSLWESSFVIAHEFAHHVQFANHPKSTTVAALRSDALMNRALEAFLEGWADLYAFYAENEDASDIVSYPCFGYNRNVASPVFGDRSFKTVTPAALAAYYQGDRTSASCMQPDFSDSHIIGAIFAHHLHQTISFLLDSGWLDEPEPMTKYRYLHRWFTSVFAQVLEDDKDPLRKIIATLYQTIARELRQRVTAAEPRIWLTEQVCDRFETGFPTLSGCAEVSGEQR